MHASIPHGRLSSLGLALLLTACGGAQTRPEDGGEGTQSSAEDTKAALVGVVADIGCGIANLIRKTRSTATSSRSSPPGNCNTPSSYRRLCLGAYERRIRRERLQRPGAAGGKGC